MEKPEVKDQINRNYRLADKRNIQDTPAFIVGGESLPDTASFDD